MELITMEVTVLEVITMEVVTMEVTYWRYHNGADHNGGDRTGGCWRLNTGQTWEEAEIRTPFSKNIIVINCTFSCAQECLTWSLYLSQPNAKML